MKISIKRKLKSIIRVVSDNNYRFLILSKIGLYNNLDDETYIKKKYKAKMNQELNLEDPVTFNEKLQWLKLYDRNNKYTMMADKYEVRNYVKNKIGEEFLIPLLGAWSRPEDVPFDKLPNEFVLKCNHNSGLGMFICKDKKKVDFNIIKRNLTKGFNQNYYLEHREWPYKNISKKIIAEKYMRDKKTSDLLDYKIFCFSGEPQIILVCSNRFSDSGLKETFFDVSWNKLDVKRPGIKNSQSDILKPQKLSEMLHLAKILSENIPFVRVDFYIINNNIYFGEMTFFPSAGFSGFDPIEYDTKLGNMLNLEMVGNIYD